MGQPISLGDEAGHFGTTGEVDLGELGHVARPLERRQRRPPAVVERLPGRRDGPVDVLVHRLGNGGDDLLGDRRDHLEHAAAGGRDPLTADVEAIVRTSHGGTTFQCGRSALPLHPPYVVEAELSESRETMTRAAGRSTRSAIRQTWVWTSRSS